MFAFGYMLTWHPSISPISFRVTSRAPEQSCDCPDSGEALLDNMGKYIARMDLLPDAQTCVLCMRWECRERFLRHRLQRKRLVSDPGMYHGTCATHVPWRMSGSLTPDGGENVPGIAGACTTRNFMYLARGPFPWNPLYNHHKTKHNISLYWHQLVHYSLKKETRSHGYRHPNY